MSNQETSPADLLKFQIRREMINLTKDCLLIVEDLCDNNYAPESNLQPRNDQYQKFRKRILDKSNNNIRELEELVDKLYIELN